MLRKVLVVAALSLAVSRAPWPQALACPFCSAPAMTLSEELQSNDMTVICKLVNRPTNVPPDAPPEQSECTFEVLETIKGKPPQEIKILYYGEQPIGSRFFAFGIDPANPAWGTPQLVDDHSVAYLRELPKLPENGADRLAFFQKYFEDSDPMLAVDAYDEFAKAPYSDLVALGPRMEHDKLVGWINDKNVSAGRRRLYLCMLSVCGRPEDVPMLEGLIKNEDRTMRTALDAMIGSYLALKGAAGLPLIEDLFLKNADSDYVDTYSAIMALRFIGQETHTIERPRLIEALRHMLKRPKLADMIIPDLARWEDWSVIDEVVALFKESDPDSSWVRVPVVRYLKACPLPEAQERLAELEKIDPDAVRRAELFFPNAGAPPDPAAATRSGEF